jgi:hypothetical protein
MRIVEKPACCGQSHYRDGRRQPQPGPCKAPATERVEIKWYCAVHAMKERNRDQERIAA